MNNKPLAVDGAGVLLRASFHLSQFAKVAPGKPDVIFPDAERGQEPTHGGGSLAGPQVRPPRLNFGPYLLDRQSSRVGVDCGLYPGGATIPLRSRSGHKNAFG